MKNAVVFLADGFEEIEALSPVDYLRRAGANVVTAAVGKDSLDVAGAHGITVKADVTLTEYLADCKELPDVVVVPGGMPGSSNIAETKSAIEFIDRMVDSERLVCAICAAPAVVLGRTKALVGKKWCCYPDMEDNASAFVDKHVKTARVVHEPNLITGIGPGAAEEFSMEIVRTLYDESTCSAVKIRSCQR